MFPLQPSSPPIGDPEKSNIAEAQDKDLKVYYKYRYIYTDIDEGL